MTFLPYQVCRRIEEVILLFLLRKADFKKFPLFGFLFAETRKANMQELARILNSDLREYL